MRPVDKGAVQGPFTDHRQARDLLIDQLGDYCCYCERPCDPDVEHVEPKGLPQYTYRTLDWDNFLLDCSVCNRQKWDDDPRVLLHYFPHEVNTAYAFRYDEASNEVVSNFNVSTHPNEHGAAERTIASLIDLNRRLDSDGRPDRRWKKRREAWQAARKARQRHLSNLPISQKDIESIRALALATGFFSIWLTVFQDQPAVCLDLIQAFPGTRQACFDLATGLPVPDIHL
ncbi:hypothetical protein [Armatimonas sp.]|uniref:hypothetical protein n=1 Tax=Armatimonas sp. TaxID=1872638 RepID=UPI00286CA728|nr:hypothetical protein [Armatimonas sp.]